MQWNQAWCGIYYPIHCAHVVVGAFRCEQHTTRTAAVYRSALPREPIELGIGNYEQLVAEPATYRALGRGPRYCIRSAQRLGLLIISHHRLFPPSAANQRNRTRISSADRYRFAAAMDSLLAFLTYGAVAFGGKYGLVKTKSSFRDSKPTSNLVL